MDRLDQSVFVGMPFREDNRIWWKIVLGGFETEHPNPFFCAGGILCAIDESKKGVSEPWRIFFEWRMIRVKVIDDPVSVTGPPKLKIRVRDDGFEFFSQISGIAWRNLPGRL